MHLLVKQKGLTLIEVLIALSIMSIAMTAIIKATSQSIRGTQYLQTKNFALWLAESMVNEITAGSEVLPEPPDQLQKQVSMLNRDWFIVAKSQATPNKRIKQINVLVYKQKPARDTDPAIIQLESYLYAAP